jgi:uncharacterized protein (TIGR00369 family)
MHDAEPAPTPLFAAGGDAPWREPVRGGHPDPVLAAKPGVELLRAMLAHETPAPPLSRLTGMRPEALGGESTRFTMPLSGWLCDESGRVPLGVLTIPSDAAMACAIIARLPAGTAITTSELAMRQLRPAMPGRRVVAEGRVLDLGPAIALAEVSVTDDTGALIAHGSSLCVILAFSAEMDAASEAVAHQAGPEPGGPDPWERPAPDAGLSRLTGLTALSTAPGEARFGIPATRWLSAPPPGRVQGGAVAMLAGAAMDAAMQSTAPDRTRFVPVELKLNYLRPLPCDGREARAHATVVHGGRRTAVARADVADADGRAIAVASGSALAERADR